MKKIFTTFMIVISFTSQAQYQTEVFNYGSTAGSLIGLPSNTGTWLQVSTIVTNPIQYNPTGTLTFPQFGTGGGTVSVASTGGQDITSPLVFSYTSGIVYLTCLVNFSSTQGIGDYFIHFNATSSSTTGLVGRVFIRPSTNAGKMQFGLLKNSGGSASYSVTDFDLNTTYAIVLKYEFVAGTTTDDIASLFVFDAASGFPNMEPTTPLLIATANTDATTIGNVNIRQGAATAAPNGILDDIIISTNWSTTFSVLSSDDLNLKAILNLDNVNLTWSQKDNGNIENYEIQNSIDGKNFTKIGLVNSIKNNNQNYYKYITLLNNNSKVFYRIKIISPTNQVSYSKIISISKKSTITISPNPTTNAVTITLNKAINTITIINSNGNIIANQKTNNNIFVLNTSAYTKGVYYIKINDGITINTEKLIVQ